MAFTPTVSIKNGVRLPRGLKDLMPLPTPRPYHQGDAPPMDDGSDTSGPDFDMVPGGGFSRPTDDNAPDGGDGAGQEDWGSRMPSELPAPPTPTPLWPKGPSEEDQLAMALAAQLMPDNPSLVLNPTIATGRRHATPGGGTYVDTGGTKRLLLPETDHSAADAFRTLMEQSRDPQHWEPGVDSYWGGASGQPKRKEANL